MTENNTKDIQALKGIKQIMLFRLLENKSKDSAQKLLYQVEHSTESSADGDSTITKDGALNNEGAIEEEITITSIIALGDEIVEMLEDAMTNRKKVEIWEINTQDKREENKYGGVYRQGLLTAMSKTNSAEDYVEMEITFKTDLTPQKGVCTLSEKQSKVVQYPFRDTSPDSVEEV